MLKKVIVPLDGSPLAEQVLPYAAGLAQALSLPLELLYVVDPASLGPRDRHDGTDHAWVEGLSAASSVVRPGTSERHQEGYLEQQVAQQEAWARLYLAGVAHDLSEALAPDTHVAIGAPEDAILAVAGPGGDCLIAMATHGRTGMLGIVLGSVAHRVLERTTTPVLLLRPGQGPALPWSAPENVVVPLDGSSMAEQALPMAADLAGALASPLLLARAVSLYEVMAPVPMPGTGAFVTMEMEQTTQAYMDSHVLALRDRGVEAESLLLDGDPGVQLRKLAAAGGNLLVMVTHGRGGMARAVTGSVADQVVGESHAPILLLKAHR